MKHQAFKMAEESQFPLFTNCKLTISNKISTKDEKLYKLITDKHQFKIIGFHPLVIEKDSLSQQDILELTDTLSAFRETKKTGLRKLNEGGYLHTHAAASDALAQQVAQARKDTNITPLTNKSEIFNSLQNESNKNQTEFTNFKHQKKLDDNSTNLHLMNYIGRLQQHGIKCESDRQTAVQTLSGHHKYSSQVEIDSSESDEESREEYVFSMKASSFHVAMFYFLKSSFQSYFRHAETDGTIFTFKLNTHNKEDVKFLDEIKQLEFENYEFANEDVVYVRSAIETVVSEVNGATLDVIGNNVHIIGSKNAVASAKRKLDSLLQNQGRNSNLPSEHLHSKDASVVKGLEKDTSGVSINCGLHEGDISGNKNIHGIIVSQRSTYPTEHPKASELYSSVCEMDVSSLSLHERSNDLKISNYRLTHSEASGSDVYSNSQSDNSVVSDQRKLEVKIYKANIAMLNVDCIVSTTNQFLVHFGGVSKAIEEAAGEDLRQECEDFIKDGNVVEITNVFVSTGGKLPVKYVMHVVGVEWDSYEKNNKPQCLNDLRHTVMRCLVEADRRGLTSIALPSISAANCGVPRKLCAECYIDAVKYFDIIIAGEETSLREVHFVDVDDSMVTLIKDCFYTSWLRPCDPEIVLKDRDFVKNHFYSASQIGTASQLETASNHNKYCYKRSSSSLSTVKKEMAVSTPLKDEKCETSVTYNFGKITLKVESRSAFDQTSDVTITIGKPFDKLSGIHDFRISSNLKQSEGMDTKENTHKFFSVPDPDGTQSYLLCEVFPDPENADMITEAFTNLEISISLQTMKELVLTSSVLYSKPTNKEQKKGNVTVVDRKKVGKFAQCLYLYLDKASKLTQDNICVTVVGDEDALITIEKVIDSHDVEKTVSGGISTSVEPENESTPVEPENESTHMSPENESTLVSPGNEYLSTKPENVCEFCYENTSCDSVICCSKLLCLNCKQSAPSCPFCNTFWRIITGSQPPGSMTVSQVSDHADGYEHVHAWKIDYYFPPGTQEVWHPSPGLKYDTITRTAYLPANINGLQVLMLLRISFLRKLTFTIGHSLRRGKDNVIIWNNISHKTGLHGGMYGYPDPNYLDQVTVELANNGVKMDTLTESERVELAKFSSSISNFKRFSDNNTL